MGTRMGVRICFVIVIVYSTSFVHLVLSHGAPRDPPSLESRLLPLSAAPHPLPRLLWFWECSSQRLVRHLVQWCLTVLRTSVLRKQKNRVTRNPFWSIKNKNKSLELDSIDFGSGIADPFPSFRIDGSIALNGWRIDYRHRRKKSTWKGSHFLFFSFLERKLDMM